MMNCRIDPAREMARGQLAWLLVSSGVSDLGDWLSLVALMVLGYERTGSAFGMSTILLVRSLPTLLCGVVAGRAADRYCRRRIMVVANAVRSLGISVLFFTQAMPVVYVVTGVVAAAGVFFRPALDAAVPNCVAPERLLRVNAWLGAGRMAAMVLGPAVASFCIAAFGVGTTFLLDGISFACFGLVLALIRFPSRRASVGASAAQGMAKCGAGWRAWCANRVVLDFLVMSAVAFAAMGALGTLELVFCVRVLHVDAHTYGGLVAVAGCGAVVTTLLLRRLAPQRAAIWYSVGIALFGAGILGFSLQTVLWATLPFLLLEGAGEAMWNVAGRTAIQLQIDDVQRGWAMSICNMVERSGILFGMILAGVLAERVAVQSLLTAAGIVVLLMCVWRLGFRMRA
ncbi:MAG: MFS transporter [Deltaproteobacteria bacterium]|nr:MFS transporter [Deltaproteobacteria bacterium]